MERKRRGSGRGGGGVIPESAAETVSDVLSPKKEL